MSDEPKPKKKRRSYKVFVDQDVCDGCGICVFFCKPLVFEISRELIPRGVFPALPLHQEQCNNCRLCELGCPQLAITVIEEGGAKAGAGGGRS